MSFFSSKNKKKRDAIINDPRTFDASGAHDESSDVKGHPKTEEEKTLILSTLKEHYVFSGMSTSDLEHVVEKMLKHEVEGGVEIIKQGAAGDVFYVLGSGKADIYVDGNKVGSYDPGHSFGELSLLYSAKRAATIKSTEKCILWTLDLKTFHKLAIRRTKSSTKSRVDFLKKVPLLSHVAPSLLTKMADALTEVKYDAGSRIITEGEKGDDFFLVKDGTVKCTHQNQTQEQVLLELGPGDYFGEMALMLDEPRHANVDALKKTTCYKISRADFVRLFGPLKDLLQQQMRIRILKSVPLLRHLADDVLDKLADAMRIQLFKAGKHVIKQGDPGSRFYIINEGTAEVISTDTAGNETIVRTLTNQDFFGERALINDEPRAASVIARNHLECLVLDRDAFRAYLADVDAVAKARKRKFASATGLGADDDDASAATKVSERPAAKDLQRFKTLGTGTFGRVSLVVHLKTKKVYALKQMQKAQVVSSHQERNIMNEKNLLLLCSHPNVLELVATYQDQNCIYMLMELVQGGELWSYIYEKTKETSKLRKHGFGCFDEPTARFYSGCVIAAFEHIHGHGIAYRDLKPENLLIDGHGYVKVIDFGFAKKVPYTDNKGQFHDKSYTICGTPEYLCPEIIQSKGHDKAVDYWALGCLIFELLAGRTPFADDRQPEIFRKILSAKKYLDPKSALWPKNFPPQAKDIVQHLCKAEAPYRLGMSQAGIADLKTHPFFAGAIDFSKLVAKAVSAPYLPSIKDPFDTSNFDPYDEEDHVQKFRGQQTLFKDWSDVGADFPPPKH